MRKAIIAVIVASALFAVGAFAAGFALSADNVSSGSDSVETCAASVTIDFAEVYEFNGEDTNDWEIETITATLSDPDSLYPSCGTTGLGAQATILIEEQDGDVVFQANNSAFTVVDATTETVEFTPVCGTETGQATCDDSLLPDGAPAGTTWTNLPVAQAWNAALLIDGNEV